MQRITYLNGDATQPTTDRPKLIVHICNDIGGWGKGFVLAITNRWKAPESEYRRWFADRDGNDFSLGAVQFVVVDDAFWVGNMVAQHGIKREASGAPPIRYDAVETCLVTVAKFATENGCSVHLPRIGCGLAGGKWEQIEPLIDKTCGAAGVTTYVYDFA